MAGGARTFKVFFAGDAKDLSAAVEKAGGHLDTLEKKASGAGSALGGMAKIAGGFVLGAGILKAPGFLLDAAKAAAEDEQATARLNQTIKNLGGDFDSINGKVNAAIGAGQKLAFSDDEVRDSFQFLAAATGDADEALRRQKAAMDLARGANIPLAQASKMLGKLNGENVEVFKKLGITLGENATETDALAAVQAKFGGQSEQFVKGPAGQFAILKLRIAEAKEALGSALLPVMVKVGDVLSQHIIPAMERFGAAVGPALRDAMPTLQTIGVVMLGVGKAIGGEGVRVGMGLWETGVDIFNALKDPVREVAGALLAMGEAIASKLAGPLTTVFGFIQEHRDLFYVFGAALLLAVPIVYALAAAHAAQATAATAAAVAEGVALLPVLLISAALAALVVGIVLLVKHWDEIVAKFPALGVAADGVKTALGAVVDWITGPFVTGVQGLVTGISGAVSGAVAFVTENWPKIQAAIEPAVKAVQIIVETAFGLIEVYIRTAIGVIQGIIDVFVGVFTGDWQRAADGVMGIIGTLKDGAVAAIGLLIDAIAGLAPLALGAGKALGGAILDGLLEGLQAVGGFVSDLGQQVFEALKVVINRGIDMINDAIPNKISIPYAPDINLPDSPIPRLALGARNFGGGLAIVGEEGPELVHLPRGAQVFTARQTAGMGGGAPINVSVYVGTVNARNRGEAERGVGFAAYGLAAALRARGV